MKPMIMCCSYLSNMTHSFPLSSKSCGYPVENSAFTERVHILLLVTCLERCVCVCTTLRIENELLVSQCQRVSLI